MADAGDRRPAAHSRCDKPHWSEGGRHLCPPLLHTYPAGDDNKKITARYRGWEKERILTSPNHGTWVPGSDWFSLSGLVLSSPFSPGLPLTPRLPLPIDRTKARPALVPPKPPQQRQPRLPSRPWRHSLALGEDVALPHKGISAASAAVGTAVKKPSPVREKRAEREERNRTDAAKTDPRQGNSQHGRAAGGANHAGPGGHQPQIPVHASIRTRCGCTRASKSGFAAVKYCYCATPAMVVDGEAVAGTYQSGYRKQASRCFI